MRIENSQLLESIFGGWPSFHDAEVTAVRMVRDAPREYGAEPVESDRYPAIELDVHLDEPQHETAQGDTIVTLRFGSVENVEVGGFNGQNVLFDLQMETSEDETGQILVSLPSSYGVGGSFTCWEVAVVEVKRWRSRAD